MYVKPTKICSIPVLICRDHHEIPRLPRVGYRSALTAAQGLIDEYYGIYNNHADLDAELVQPPQKDKQGQPPLPKGIEISLLFFFSLFPLSFFLQDMKAIFFFFFDMLGATVRDAGLQARRCG
jgi:hypothetical protein